jgi:O-antigen/teichoic acid export membrane protein
VTLAANMLANGLGRVWLAILHLVMTPLIAGVLGPDSYGLIAFSLTVTLLLSFLDQALSPLLIRALASCGEDEAAACRARDLLRTLEALSWSVGIIIGLCIALAAPWIADAFLSRSSLARDDVVAAVRLIGFAVAAQWPGLLYAGGFMGLGRQDTLVMIRLVFVTAAYVGGLLLIATVSASAGLYLAWSGAMALLGSFTMGCRLWRIMPKSGRAPAFAIASLEPVWRFGAGSLLIGVTAVILSQVPALVVAQLTTVADFAAYTLAMTLAMQVSTLLTQPVTATLLPHFSRLVAQNPDALAAEHHRWSQIIAVLALPAIATLAFYAEPLMRLWLGAGSPLAGPVAALLPYASLGALFNIVVTPLYVLSMASGRPRLVLVMNFVAVALMLPAAIWLTGLAGAKGAAICWLALNAGYYLLGAPAVHAALLPGEIRRWWLQDTLSPMAMVAALYGAAWLLWPVPAGWLAILAQASVLAGLAVALLLATHAHARQAARDAVGRATAFLNQRAR